jgi:DNA-binding HxlR family transcriptional regulator
VGLSKKGNTLLLHAAHDDSISTSSNLFRTTMIISHKSLRELLKKLVKRPLRNGVYSQEIEPKILLKEKCSENLL